MGRGCGTKNEARVFFNFNSYLYFYFIEHGTTVSASTNGGAGPFHTHTQSDLFSFFQLFFPIAGIVPTRGDHTTD